MAVDAPKPCTIQEAEHDKATLDVVDRAGADDGHRLRLRRGGPGADRPALAIEGGYQAGASIWSGGSLCQGGFAGPTLAFSRLTLGARLGTCRSRDRREQLEAQVDVFDLEARLALEWDLPGSTVGVALGAGAAVMHQRFETTGRAPDRWSADGELSLAARALVPLGRRPFLLFELGAQTWRSAASGAKPAPTAWAPSPPSGAWQARAYNCGELVGANPIPAFESPRPTAERTALTPCLPLSSNISVPCGIGPPAGLGAATTPRVALLLPSPGLVHHVVGGLIDVPAASGGTGADATIGSRGVEKASSGRCTLHLHRFHGLPIAAAGAGGGVTLGTRAVPHDAHADGGATIRHRIATGKIRGTLLIRDTSVAAVGSGGIWPGVHCRGVNRHGVSDRSVGCNGSHVRAHVRP